MKTVLTLSWLVGGILLACSSTPSLANEVCPAASDEQALESLAPARNLPPHLRHRWRAALGRTEAVAGEPHFVRDGLGVTAGSDFGEMEVVVRLAHLSDIHVFDEESPARQYWSGWLSPTIYRYQEAHTTQVLDAAVRTINGLDQCGRDIDFAVLSGDLLNNRQRNELRWVMGVLDGEMVHPDSGADDNPLDSADPHDPFLAEGLQIPWYANVGNHDLLFEGHARTHLLMGSSSRSKARFVVEPFCENNDSLPVLCQIAAPTHHYHHRRIDLTADEERTPTDKFEIIEVLLESTSLPVGHGFVAENVEHQVGYWTSRPHDGLRLVGLDTSAPSGVFGRLDSEQLEFLEVELTAAETEGELVIVTSHHSSKDLKFGWGPRLRRLLWRHPNVVLHLAGHRHRHRIRARQPAILPPQWRHERGYWEILTGSLIDWPQQLRLVEIGLGQDGVGAIRSTVVDYEAPPDSVVSDARFYALYGRQKPSQTLLAGGGAGSLGDRNVVLPFCVPGAQFER